MAGTFETLIVHTETALTGFYTAASGGMSHYVMPLAWIIFGISMLVWSFYVTTGRITFDVSNAMLSCVFIVLVLFLASGGYNRLIAGPLYRLPDSLATALGSTAAPHSVLDVLFDKLLNMLSGIVKAISDQAKDWNIGAALVLLWVLVVVAVTSALLLTGATFVYLYAKIGISLVLAVGPFFIVMLAWNATRTSFYPWLNTVLSLAFLYVMTHLFINLFIGIVNLYMDALMRAIGGSDPGTIAGAIAGAGPAHLNVMVIAMQVAAITLPMFFVLLQLPAVSQSITAASAGAFGQGAMGIAQAARSFGAK